MASDCQLRVLVVDDEAEIRDILSILLSFWGHEVFVAKNGEEALQVVNDFRPDLVVSDIAMPVMDGLEMVRRLRRLPEFQDTFCVALTGLGHDDDRKRSHEASFDMHLLKPVVPEVLKAVIGTAVKRRSRAQA
jgi:two-component system, chemotaxis family, CheB/CheR fusion protein